jgi:hypothetical protein
MCSYLSYCVGIAVLVMCVYCCTCCFMCVLLSYLSYYVGIAVLVVLCVYCCTCRTMCVLLYWLYYVCSAVATLDAELLAKVSIRKVLRPATSTQVFLGFPVSISKC